MTIAEALQWGSSELREACERPRFEAELLLAHHLGQERTFLTLQSDSVVKDLDAFRVLVARRAAYEPLEYITGRVSFYDIELAVQPGVLIPRPETELLIDRVAEIIEREQITRIAEIGVGSGAISIVLARKFPELRIIATDISDAPLRVAGNNSAHFGLEGRITLRKGSLLDEVIEAVELVVSNPPYIANDFVLEPNVGKYEPREALFGGQDGDELLHRIVEDVAARGIKFLACEMGYVQRESMQKLLEAKGAKSMEFYKDLAGHDRGFVAEFDKQ